MSDNSPENCAASSMEEMQARSMREDFTAKENSSSRGDEREEVSQRAEECCCGAASAQQSCEASSQDCCNLQECEDCGDGVCSGECGESCCSSASSEQGEESQGQQHSSEESSAEGEGLTPLGKAKQEAAEYLEALQRERADFLNYRARTLKEQDRFRQHGIIDVLTALLPAMDDIDRIRQHGNLDDSFKAVSIKIDKAFEKFGVEKFGEKGERFDPTCHEAILHRQDDNVSDDMIDTVVEAGYRVGDRVIRAARVVVVSARTE